MQPVNIRAPFATVTDTATLTVCKATGASLPTGIANPGVLEYGIILLCFWEASSPSSETSYVLLPKYCACSVQGVLAVNHRKFLTYILVRRPVFSLAFSTAVGYQLATTTTL